MASKRVAVLASLARPAARRATPALALCARAASASARPVHRATFLSRTYASHAPSSEPSYPTGSPQAVGAQLRAAVETELNTLTKNLSELGEPLASSHVHRYLRPLSPEEVELVNMGQVPVLPGGQVMALLDLNLLPAPFDREKEMAGPEGKGVHVPLLAFVGTTDPAVPCYPLSDLFEKLGPRLVRAVHNVLDAQRKAVKADDGATTDVDADERSPLVALMAPHEGQKRDLGIQLAIGLFRLAMHEGNGHTEEIAKE